MSRAKALWLLTWALLLTLAKRSLGLGRRGTAWFHRNYATDGLAPLTAAEREQLPAFSRCVACGVCDRDETERMLGSGGEYQGLMSFVLSASRSMPDYGVAYRAIRWVPETVLESKEAQCPEGVPFRKLAAFVAHKADKARISLPVVAGP